MKDVGKFDGGCVPVQEGRKQSSPYAFAERARPWCYLCQAQHPTFYLLRPPPAVATLSSLAVVAPTGTPPNI